MPNDAVLIYLVLRAMEVHDGTFSTDALTDMLGLTGLTVRRMLEQLRKKNWIQIDDGKCRLKDETGKWLLEVVLENDPKRRPRSQEHVEEVQAQFSALQERLRTEHRAKATSTVSKLLGKVRARKKSAADVLNRFRQRFEDEYDEPYIVSRQKALAQCRRTLNWAGGDFEHVVTVIEFLFDNWDRIRRYMKLNEGRPGLGLITTATMWTRIRDLSVTGFKQDFTIKDRARDTEGPLVGWGNETD